MICYINRSTVDYDVRLYKYVQACKSTYTPYFVISWDRLLNAKNIDENEYQMKHYCPYSQGKKIWPLFKWICFIWYYLIRNFRKYQVIHACNMENTLFVLPFKLLGKKIVFDVYDSQIISIEQKLIPKVDLLILQNIKRLEQIGIPKNKVKELLIIENVPALDYNLKPLAQRKDDKIHLSYVGTFQKEIRGIENLLKLVSEDERFILDIAGTGDDLDNAIREYAAECDRIHYYGKVLYTDALEIMHSSDFIVALYYLCAPVHRYASPNKFHESLFLGRPIITSMNTLVGERVQKANTGYVVEDSIDGLKSVFKDFGSDEEHTVYRTKCKNCEEMWKNKYKNYRKEWMEGEYIKHIYSLSMK